ncbi:PTS sugar transporter [Paenibacillaceae bacterium]|nr:PTS sugar transporter [Paenibacillaceae bacterium]
MLAILHKIGKSLMLPVAVLPAASILLRFGNIDYEQDFRLGDFGAWLNRYIAPFLDAGGSAIFDHLPLIFAISIGIGIGKDAVAALAAVIGHLVLNYVLVQMPIVFSDWKHMDSELNTGVLGGILSGLVASYFYKRYYQIKLPDWLGFFSGKRFVPIVTSATMIVIAVGLGMIWGPVQHTLDSFGRWVIDLGGIGALIYTTTNRLLIPFGLHHVLNNIAWFQIGTYVNPAGKIFHGDLNRFFAGDPEAGMLMAGFFPIMMFALPAAALAIVNTAHAKKRKMISSIFLSAALASFLTGITEPLEFAFMFAAPLLYVIHALLTGLSAYIAVELGVRHGFGFSAGFIDYIINYPLAANPLLIVPLGLLFAVVYYFLFRFMILKLNLLTPGREPVEAIEVKPVTASQGKHEQTAVAVAEALGGPANIQSIDACITRLRLSVHDESLVNEEALKKLGALGVIRLGKGSIQAIFGMESEKLKDQIKMIL